MKHCLWLFALLFLASPARAETRLEVDGAACDHLVTYVEPPGVEYRPGVDADGNPVAPADLNGGSQIKLPIKVTIPITDYLYSKLANASGQPAPNGFVQPSLTVGVVTYDITSGQLTFNGQPLTTDPDGALAQLCRKARAQ